MASRWGPNRVTLGKDDAVEVADPPSGLGDRLPYRPKHLGRVASPIRRIGRPETPRRCRQPASPPTGHRSRRAATHRRRCGRVPLYCRGYSLHQCEVVRLTRAGGVSCPIPTRKSVCVVLSPVCPSRESFTVLRAADYTPTVRSHNIGDRKRKAENGSDNHECPERRFASGLLTTNCLLPTANCPRPFPPPPSSPIIERTMAVIEIENLSKSYRVYQKKEGLNASDRGLFRRELSDRRGRSLDQSDRRKGPVRRLPRPQRRGKDHDAEAPLRRHHPHRGGSPGYWATSPGNEKTPTAAASPW